MSYFEVVSKYKDKDIKLPERATRYSAGYDIEAAEDIIVPSIFNKIKNITIERCITSTKNAIDLTNSQPIELYGVDYQNYFRAATDEVYTLDEIKEVVRKEELVTMIPTGLKVKLGEYEYLSIHSRSSIGINSLLMLPNQTGIIDSDYYNNPGNEGHIFIPMINLSPYDIQIKKGDRIAQGIIEEYKITEDEGFIKEIIDKVRQGGFGSTDSEQYITKIEFEPAEKSMTKEEANHIIDACRKITNNGAKIGPKTQKKFLQAIRVLGE